MKVLSSLLSIVSFALLVNTQASAQDLDTGTISGRVVDPNGAVIPGVNVRAKASKTSSLRTTTTNIDGRFKLIQLEPGLYGIQIQSSGFASQQFDDLNLHSGQTVTLDLTLKPSAIETEAVVISSSDLPLVDTKRTVVGSTMNARETDTLPIASRSPFDLIFILPGVTEEPLSTRDLAEDRNTTPNSTPEEAGTFSLAGSPAYSNNMTIDGLDNNDDRAARERFQPPLDSIEEVQVITNQFSAEYGRASGGRINLRTRSGTSAYHGRLSYFFRDEALNANTYKNNSLGLPRLPLQEHLGAFSLSGPVPKWLFRQRAPTFFAAYELSKVLDSALIDTLVPVAKNPLFALPSPTNLPGRRVEIVNPPALPAEVAPFVSSLSTPLRSGNLTLRGDYQFNNTSGIAVVYQNGRLRNLRQFGGGNRLAEALQGRTRNSDALSVSQNLVTSGGIVNQGRFQYSRLTPGFLANSTDGPVVLLTLNDPLAAGEIERRTGTLVAGSSTSGSSDRRESRWQVQNITSFLRGNHSLRVGADLHRVRSEFIDLADVSGTYNFASAGDFLAGIPSRFRQTFDTSSTQINTYVGVFFQDEWQLLPQLLLSYGIRYEREAIVKDNNNFGPRLSFAYSPFASGKTVIRFGGGLFYNRALLRTIDDFTLGQQRLFFDTNTVTDLQTGNLLSAEQRRNFIAARIRFPEILSASSEIVKQHGVLNSEFSRRLDADLRIPESYQINLGVERDLGRGFALETNFTLTRGIHLWREFNANTPLLPQGYSDFSAYLASRDFANFVDPINRLRPLYNVSSAGELVRFALGSNASTVERIMESGVPVSVFNLNTSSATTALDVALGALNGLRPDPSKTEVEQLISVGNSFYRAMTVELRRRFVTNESGGSIVLRAGYTLSRLIDDGIVNTSDALIPGDFRAERARSLLDRRHRFVFSGTLSLPKYLGGLQLSPFLRIASGAPFNISIGGVDRNLDDVGNDRPNFSGEIRQLHWRSPGSVADQSVLAAFSLPRIGQSGNLPRNAGHGPGLFLFDLSITREFQLGEKIRIRPVIELDNVLNKTVFSFGAEFINFNALSSSATDEQRAAFHESFLLATRTLRPRQLRLGLKIDF